LLLYGEAGFRQVEYRFFSVCGNVAHLAKTTVRSQINNFVAWVHLTRVIVGPQWTIVVVGCYIAGMRRKTDHFRCLFAGKLISKYPVIDFQVGNYVKLFGPFIYTAYHLAKGSRCKQQEQYKGDGFIHFAGIEDVYK